MQPATASPRDALTVAAVTALIRDAPALRISAGCELIDQSLTVQADITDILSGGSITRQSYADLHGSAQLSVEGALDWGTAIVRPYMTLASPYTTARFNLGAYYTSTPKKDLGESPVIYDVTGLDILDGLNTPVGEVYTVAAGISYLSSVEAILLAQGYTAYTIDQASAAAVLPSARVWPMDDNTTWLSIVNDLLGSIGYAGIWSDWDGRLRVHPYIAPGDRGSEWTYTVDTATSMLTPARSIERDYYRAPNRWVFYRTNNVDGPAPIEGDGIYTYVNTSNGPTSVEARNGRVITKQVGLDVADQASLVSAAQITINADLRLKAKITVGTSPNPLHWHFDRLTVADPELGPTAQVLSSSWSLPLNGADMTHEWTVL